MRAPRRHLAALVMAALGLAAPSDLAAQSVDPVPAGPVQPVVLTLDQERLFTESAFGQASLARERAAAAALEAENSRIEAELVAEEQALTARRGTVPAEEFSALAAAFDEKVERIRGEQDAKVRDIGRAREIDRQAFLRAAVPVLGDLLGEFGALVILDQSTVILALSAIDVTDEAISKVDAVLGAEAPPTPAPAP